MNISVKDLKEELEKDNPPIVIDIRESEELLYSSVSFAIHIPMQKLNVKMQEYSKEDNLVIMCRSGARSDSITKALLNAGYKNTKNLVGGINEWARKIDKSLNVY